MTGGLAGWVGTTSCLQGEKTQSLDGERDSEHPGPGAGRYLGLARGPRSDAPVSMVPGTLTRHLAPPVAA